MNIKQAISNWDGKSADDIAAIYHHHSGQSSFLTDIIALIEHPSFQKPASWLLKYHLESGAKLEVKTSKNIYVLLTKLKDWESRLHILQCIPMLPIEKTDKKKVELFLRDCLCDRNKFVRAWAYNGFYELSSQYPEYLEETKQFFEMAMRDEAASVKARIRNIMKKGF